MCYDYIKKKKRKIFSVQNEERILKMRRKKVVKIA